MNEKVLKTLEFNKIISMLERKAVSAMGKELAAALVPGSDIHEIRRGLKETGEAESMILKKGSIPLGGVRDIREAMKRAAVGGTLSIESLLDTGDFLYVCRKISVYGKKEGKIEDFEILDPLFGGLAVLAPLENELTRCIAGASEIKDDASQKLASIRRTIRKSGDSVREHLNSIIHSPAYKSMLQDSIITMRNGRYCVPVKQEYRSQLSGMIHDQSSTGATLFVEPMSVVTLNNKIKELYAEEQAEIEVILRRLSAMVAENLPAIQANFNILTELDFMFAKGELSLETRGSAPIFNERGYINLRKARHPLLNRETVVPIDVHLGGDFTTLLITGPNTGGKTVSLKTIGLLTLMGQAGLHIPARDKSELAVFDEVFADIGDEQSIEQSLSTFSSHMTNIVRILEHVTDNSLVLLDELGAGTDPTEGAALALALVNYFRELRIRTVITTHYSELKVYAISTERAENACCEFDVETLRPTFRLLVGVPGKSNAFAISKKLGLPDFIIDAAKTAVSHENVRFEDVITDLEISRKTAQAERERAESYRREAESLKKDYENQKDKLAAQRDKFMLDAKNEARKITETARDEAALIIKEMRKMAAENAGLKEAEALRTVLRETIVDLDGDIAEMSKERLNLKPVTGNLKIGDRVYIHSVGQSGVVASAPSANGDLTVRAGSMKIKVNVSALSLDETKVKEDKADKPRTVSTNVKNTKSLTIYPEIDLRGMTAHEATEEADKFLDDAKLASLSQIRIIHGKGTGVLRSAVHDLLSKRRVKYRLGKYGEGEDGVTVVEL